MSKFYSKLIRKRQWSVKENCDFCDWCCNNCGWSRFVTIVITSSWAYLRQSYTLKCFLAISSIFCYQKQSQSLSKNCICCNLYKTYRKALPLSWFEDLRKTNFVSRNSFCSVHRADHYLEFHLTCINSLKSLYSSQFQHFSRFDVFLDLNLDNPVNFFHKVITFIKSNKLSDYSHQFQGWKHDLEIILQTMIYLLLHLR